MKILKNKINIKNDFFNLNLKKYNGLIKYALITTYLNFEKFIKISLKFSLIKALL